MLKTRTLVIRSGKIASYKSVQNPTACPVRELGDVTVLPGLIDAHTHLLLSDETYGDDFQKELLREAALPEEARLRRARGYAESLLRHGFTTVRDLGNSGVWLDRKLREDVGLRLLISGPGIGRDSVQFATGTAPAGVAREYSVLQDTREIASLIQERVRHRAEWVKVYADNDPGLGRLPEAWLKQITLLAHANGLLVAAHATQEASVQAALRAGVDSIEHGGELSEEAFRLLNEHRAFWVPTLVSRPTRAIRAAHGYDPGPDPGVVKRAMKAGVRIAFGSDAYLNLEREGWDRGEVTFEAFRAFDEAGMKPIDAIRAATWEAANLLRRPDLGTLSVGASADLIAVRGDPRQDLGLLRRPTFVLAQGEIVALPKAPSVIPATLPARDVHSQKHPPKPKTPALPGEKPNGSPPATEPARSAADAALPGG